MSTIQTSSLVIKKKNLNPKCYFFLPCKLSFKIINNPATKIINVVAYRHRSDKFE